MNQIPAGSVDLIVTSPPYNLLNSVGNGMKSHHNGIWANPALVHGYSDHSDNMPHEDYVAWQKTCVHSMWKLLNDTGAIFYNHKWRVQNGLCQRLADEITADLPVRQIIIWQRSGGFNFNEGYFVPTYEVIYLIAKPDFKLLPKANRHGDIWKIHQEVKNAHPAPFPLDLVKKCIQSTDAQVILDPFMGSGTTAVAAIISDRNWIGIDISEKYCIMARKRIETHSRMTSFFERT